MSRLVLSLAASALLCVTAQAQSLGDIARQQQQKKNREQASASNVVPKKVLTNDDLPKSPSEAVSKPASDRGTAPLTNKQASTTWSAEQFRAEIQKRKDAIAEIQKAIDKIEPTINYVQNNRNIYTNAPEYNADQDEKRRIVSQLKGRLAEQQSELDDLRERAQQAGYGNSVYQ